MECNKDEANKARVISEQKLTKNDFSGAKKFALKARTLYPGMDGLSQLMTTIDVFIAAEKKVGQSGEVDWYGVLGVTPTADDMTIKKQYRKMSLMVHPDKNNCTGAEGAFKLVSEAWSLLSDKAKRCSYDQRRISNVRSSNISTKNNKSSSSSSGNYMKRDPSKTSFSFQVACIVCDTPHDTFVTRCNRCRTRQEHLIRYQDTTISCIHCKRLFTAVVYFHKLCCLGEPTPVSPAVIIGKTFLTTCQKCRTPQEHLKVHMDKIVTCSHCRKPFKLPTVENDDNAVRKIALEEASKAKVISEQRLMNGDLSSAKKFSLKAHALYPGMYGLSQLMATIDVYASAEKKVGSCFEVDFYGVLGVAPTADDETIMKQYCKIALLLHPGNNVSFGANFCYEIVSEAWKLLSDKAKRDAYDQRRTSYVISSNIYTNKTGSSSSSSCNNVGPQPSNTVVLPQAICQACHTSHDTFVACCSHCKTPQEHLNRYLKTTIICIYCQTRILGNNFIPKLCSPRPPEAMIYNTFLATCKKCHKPQEHLKVHMDKIVMCSHCRNPMKVTSAENDVRQQANNVGMKRPREEAQGAGGGCERRDKVCK